MFYFITILQFVIGYYSRTSYEQPLLWAANLKWEATPKNDIPDANEASMISHLPWKVTFPLSQGWLLIAGSTVIGY